MAMCLRRPTVGQVDRAPYCHPIVGSDQAFFLTFGILCVSSEAGRLESCGLLSGVERVSGVTQDWDEMSRGRAGVLPRLTPRSAGGRGRNEVSRGSRKRLSKSGQAPRHYSVTPLE